MKTAFGKKRTLQILLAGLICFGAASWAVAQQATITPTAKELNKSFDADASQWTERFEHEGRAIYDKRFEILDAMNLKPGMNVADIGAGSGLFSRLVAGRVAPGGTVYAVDISKNMIDHIAKVAKDENIPNLKPVLGDPKSPKLAPNSVDVVFIIDSYHHFEYPADMLAEINKALRPDGMLMLIDFKRIDRVSPEYILKMVRAGEGTFTDEFLNAGFDLVERRDDMFPDNYMLKFKHRVPAAVKSTAQR
ncbi:MAG TPA: methyltransferase domain-containing protein [Bryobacteraceae bacterium]|nr:methyltransferase domain-containing protein [Bryobacteraceae bacterium]